MSRRALQQLLLKLFSILFQLFQIRNITTRANAVPFVLVTIFVFFSYMCLYLLCHLFCLQAALAAKQIKKDSPVSLLISIFSHTDKSVHSQLLDDGDSVIYLESAHKKRVQKNKIAAAFSFWMKKLNRKKIMIRPHNMKKAKSLSQPSMRMFQSNCFELLLIIFIGKRASTWARAGCQKHSSPPHQTSTALPSNIPPFGQILPSNISCINIAQKLLTIWTNIATKPLITICTNISPKHLTLEQ